MPSRQIIQRFALNNKQGLLVLSYRNLQRGSHVRPIEIFPGVLSLILSRSARAERTEIGGFLYGKIRRNRLLITGATFPRQVGTRTHVSINDVDMALLAEELAEKGTGEVIVGWWHSHPGLGAGFMSGTDVSTQLRYQAFFPDAVALVVDPMRFSESLNLAHLDLHVYTVEGRKAKDLDYVYAHDPKEIIPDLYSLMLTLEAPAHVIFEDTWFERMLRGVFSESITTPEFTMELGRFTEAAVTFGVVCLLLLFVALSLTGLFR
jgi:proteasome lid subunit RPN8/RPN11